MNKGFTLVDTLLALLAIAAATLLLTPLLKIIMTLSYPLSNSEDLLGVMRIRYQLSQSIQKELTKNSISYRYHNEEWTLSFHNHNLVKEPGYEIMLMHLKEVTFTKKNGCIYLDYVKENKNDGKEVLLVCE